MKIRAVQGHSVAVNLGYVKAVPPQWLFHGTGEKSVDAILDSGIKSMNRQHVHLSVDMVTAMEVGKRQGKPRIFMVAASDMASAGHEFWISSNGVWLCESVSKEFIYLC